MNEQANSSGIAIVGMAGRFPGARDVDELWQNLAAGVESIRYFSDQELVARGVEPALLRDPRYVKAAAVADGVETFDAAFFGMTAREAELVDPQQRVFLETTWQALENAGYDSGGFSGSIGVYAGCTINTYLLFHIQTNPEITRTLDLAQLNIASGRDFLTTRVSYKLDLRGPSHLVQSACSTSLVAVHLACQSLYDGQCDMALAGGVSVNVKLMSGYRHVEGGMTSPDGHCRAFDARAAGTLFGAGAAAVVLKRLEDALADGDTIRAVIKGSAINNDGAAKVGFTAPSVDGQAKVITEALADAGVEPGSVAYVETHGTGTALGDPIEVQALKRAFGPGAEGTCALGSVKSNLGHLDAAAGVTSLIKTVLALEHRAIPPSLHFERPNPEIDFAGSPFFVNDRLSDWARGGAPRRAGVSSFGVGGTNAHVILEEAPAVPAPGESRPWQLVVLSARTLTALEARTRELADWLEPRPELSLADVAYTAALGRRPFEHRRVLVCAAEADTAAALRAREPARRSDGRAGDAERPVVFLFPSTSGRCPGAGRELYRLEPVFRAQVDACSELLRPELGLDLSRALFPDAGGGEPAPAAGPASERLAAAAAFALEHALGRLWLSWGMRPQAMVGAGAGEYVAACLAGVLPLADALALACARAEVEVGPQDGSSSHADRAFAQRAGNLSPGAPAIPYVSSLTGSWVGAGLVAEPDYWLRQLADGPGLDDGLAELLGDPSRAFLELGWGGALGRRAAEHPARGDERTVLSPLPATGDPESELAALLGALGRLWLIGVGIDWRRFYGGQRRRRVPLPPYPFERKRYWIEPGRQDGGGERPVAAAPARAAARHPRPELAVPYAPPATPLESCIVRVWANALGLEQVGLDDVFFDLGGDSFVAVQVMDELTVELGRPIPAVSLYEELTVRSLAALLEAGGDGSVAEEVAASVGREGRTARRKEYQESRRSRRKEHGRP
jgi:acyl transferase domain-containing protein